MNQRQGKKIPWAGFGWLDAGLCLKKGLGLNKMFMFPFL